MRTERLLLRRFLPSDRQFVLELHQGAEIRRFISSAVLTEPEEADAWIARSVKSGGPLHGFWCVTLQDGSPVAAVLLANVTYSEGHWGDEVEIGWRTHPAHMGQGYATEAAQRLMTAALETEFERVIAVVDPENLASQKVCSHLGMTHLGRSDAYYDEELEMFEEARCSPQAS